jgi:hypothetical protein
MITQGWFLEKVLKKQNVPNFEVCPQPQKTDFERLGTSETRMDKGFQRFVPSVPTEKESLCVLSENIERETQDLETIHEWLIKIGEAEEDHPLVLDKCRNDPQALAYYLRQANGEFENKPALTSNASPDVGARSKEDELETIRQWMIDGGRLQADYLFKLIVEKCAKDEVARKRFVQEALAVKARTLSNAEAAQQPIINEKVIHLPDRDDRRYCNDCAFLDRQGYCKQWKKTNPANSRYRPVKDVLRRCAVFRHKEQSTD